MKRNHWQIQAILLFYFLAVVKSKVATLNECEKRCHSSLNAQQKAELCQNYEVDYSLGPAVCSVAAKEKLHLQFKDIFKLCYLAESDGPVECMLALPQNKRNSIGYSLCKQASSSLPAQCFHDVSSFKGSFNKLTPENLLQFCQNLQDIAPLKCVQSATEHTKITPTSALSLCKNAVGSGSMNSQDPMNYLSSSCIESMSSHIQPSFGITADAIVKFCVSINPLQYHDNIDQEDDNVKILFQTASVSCYESLTESLHDKAFSNQVSSISGLDRLDICSNAPNPLGPVNCTIQTLTKLKAKDSFAKISGKDLQLLCHSAPSSAPSNCFIESHGLGNHSIRANLCNSAENAGPAHCYRKAMTTFKNDEENRRFLCIGAISEGPAACTSEAPHYLANEEKVLLCGDAPVDRYRETIQCLQVVQSHSRNFMNAPKKALGYFQGNLQSDDEWTSRGLLISLCSFSDSQHPLASAECFRSSPTSLNHDDVARMCTNISSTEVIQHIQLCHRLMPKSWKSEIISNLCESLTSKKQVEAAVSCALDSWKLKSSSANQLSMISQLDIAKVCSHETVENIVSSCMKSIFLGNHVIRSANYQFSNKTLHDLCAIPVEQQQQQKSSSHGGGQHFQNPGECFIQVLTSFASAHSSVQPDIPVKICRMMASSSTVAGSGSGSAAGHTQSSTDPKFLLNCLLAQRKKLITSNEFEKCSHEKRKIMNFHLKKLWNEENGIELIAGTRFSLLFEVYDQYNQIFNPSSLLSSPLIKISINENNHQGAALWGNRLNATNEKGLLLFQQLTISQPGPVHIILSDTSDVIIPAGKVYHRSQYHQQQHQKIRVINSILVTVKENPRFVTIRPCLFVFLKSFCPMDLHHQAEEDYNSLFPMTRHFLPSSNYVANLQCFNESLALMRVSSYLNVDGSMWVEYRQGIDSIWTSIGLPTLEMAPTERLQLILPSSSSSSSTLHKEMMTKKEEAEEAKKTLKLIKRAYYRSSLQWHPDRWVGYEAFYQTAVQAIFPLITDAYQRLSEQYEAIASAASSAAAAEAATSSAMYDEDEVIEEGETITPINPEDQD